jgi:hypothetical protein
MFEFEGKHFMLAIGAILLLLGAIIFYFKNRVGALEKAIGKQNQVLSSFIANVQSELRGAVSAPAAGGHMMEAPTPPERCGIPDDKIEVSSDDYDSDSDSSNTSSSDEETVLKIGEEEADVKVIEMLNEAKDIIEYQENAVSVTEVLLKDITPHDISGDIDDIDDIDDIVADAPADDDDDDGSDDDEDDDDDDDDEDDEDDDQTDSDTDAPPTDDINVKKLINVELDTPVDYNSEKKSVLIEFCKDKGLGNESTLKRYKKQELVNLLSSA